MQLPRRAEQHIIESVSYRIFSSILPDDWIIRDVTERDYGIDCYIEICSNGFVTGQLLSIQLKGSEKIEKQTNGAFVTYYGINPSTFNYWNNIPVPTIFINIDISEQIAYFSNIKRYIRSNYSTFSSEKLTSIKIPKTHTLDKESAGLILQVLYLIENDRENFENRISNYVVTLSDTVEFLSSHYCRDCFLPLDEDENHEMKFYNAYRDIKYLADRFSIKWEIKNVSEMIEEGQKMFGNTYLLYEKQIAEFVEQIVPVVKELTAKLVERITISESDYWKNTNYILWKYVLSRDFQSQVKELEEF